jgi:hypothetical protein
MRKWAFGVVAVALVAMSGQGVALADSSAAQLPPNWHIHDGGSGPQHKAISFFPTILGISVDTYLQDPARCPNATDKVFLPSEGKSNSAARRRMQNEHDDHPPAKRASGYFRTRGLAVAHHAYRARLHHLLQGHAEVAAASKLARESRGMRSRKGER